MEETGHRRNRWLWIVIAGPAIIGGVLLLLGMIDVALKGAEDGPSATLDFALQWITPSILWVLLVAPLTGVFDSVGAERGRQFRLWFTLLFFFVGLPLYLIVASSVVGTVTAPTVGPGGEVVRSVHWSVELLIYAALGTLWALPLKKLVQGLGRKAPEESA